MKKPLVYFAGKIGKNDWRHDLVPGLRNALFEDGPFDVGAYAYNGPFFISCDHGCNHGPNTHGALPHWGDTAQACFEPDGHAPPDKREVARRALEGVRTANLLFAYVEALNAVGTMVEIGVAIQLSIPVVLCVTKSVDANELWLAAQCPGVTLRSCVTPGALPQLLNSALNALPGATRKRFAR